jgi:alkylation response protein AidB-like acyl-CoA dehydrogenase
MTGEPSRPFTSNWSDGVDPEFLDVVRTFVEHRVAPAAARIDELDLYPREIIKELALIGCNAMTLSHDLGGGGQSYVTAGRVIEEIGYGSAAVGISLITIFQAQTMIRLFGRETLQARYLPLFGRGLIASYALTEAAHGSDIRSLDTKARRDGDDWVILGEKSFITSGSAAEFFVILAETEVGVSVFAVPKETPGLSTYEGPSSATFGLRNGPHVNVRFDSVRLPADHLIGTEGKGVRQAAMTLSYSRTLAAAISVGIARAAFDHALNYVRTRKAFGQTVLQFQGIQWYFADILTRIDAARLLVVRACEALDRNEEVARFSSEAKLFASETATAAASMAIQVCGAYGTTTKAPFERLFRDAKTYEIGGGSSEVLKNTIAKSIEKYLENQ